MRLVRPPAAGEVVARVFVHHQHLLGVGLLFTRSRVTDRAVTSLNGRRGYRRAWVTVVRCGHRPGREVLPGRLSRVRLVLRKEIGLILRGILAGQPGPPPPPEDHRRSYRAERDRSP